MREEGVSIAICCHNAQLRIEKCLEALFHQKTDSNLSIEIIVVDNASTDQTAEKVKQIYTKYQASQFDKILVHETQLGILYARKKAFSVAKKEFLLFVDDDNYLFEDYVNKAYKIMKSHPEMGILGGQGILPSTHHVPDWFPLIAYNFAIGSESEKIKSISQVSDIHAAGSIIRYDVWNTLIQNGFEWFLQSRTGQRVMSGEDTELCFAFQLAGYKIYYEPQLLFYHDILQERIRWDYVEKLNYSFGAAKVVIDIYQYCLKQDRHPALNYKLPLWLDRWIYLRQAHRKFKKNHDIRKYEGNTDRLLYIGQKGEMDTLRTLKQKYSIYFTKVLTLKQNLNKQSF